MHATLPKTRCVTYRLRLILPRSAVRRITIDSCRPRRLSVTSTLIAVAGPWIDRKYLWDVYYLSAPASGSRKKERKVLKSSRIIENVLERVDEEGGRYVLNTDILERESWRVVKNDSKEEKSGREVGNCVKGSRMRKPVPVSPPEEELLPECLRGTLSKV